VAAQLLGAFLGVRITIAQLDELARRLARFLVGQAVRAIDSGSPLREPAARGQHGIVQKETRGVNPQFGFVEEVARGCVLYSEIVGKEFVSDE